MKLKLAVGVILSCGICAAADAAPATSNVNLNLGSLVLPLNNLANVGLPALNPLLQPVLSQTGPLVGGLVGSLHPALLQLTPLFTTVDTLTGIVGIPAIPLTLPGLPN